MDNGEEPERMTSTDSHYPAKLTRRRPARLPLPTSQMGAFGLRRRPADSFAKQQTARLPKVVNYFVYYEKVERRPSHPRLRYRCTGMGVLLRPDRPQGSGTAQSLPDQFKSNHGPLRTLRRQ